MGRGFEPPTESEYNNRGCSSVANDWPANFFAKKNRISAFGTASAPLSCF